MEHSGRENEKTAPASGTFANPGASDSHLTEGTSRIEAERLCLPQHANPPAPYVRKYLAPSVQNMRRHQGRSVPTRLSSFGTNALGGKVQLSQRYHRTSAGAQGQRPERTGIQPNRTPRTKARYAAKVGGRDHARLIPE